MKEYKDWTLEEARLLCDDRHDRGLYCKGCTLDGVCCEDSRAMVPRYWRTDKRMFTDEEIAFAKTFQAACMDDVIFRRIDETTLLWSSGGSIEVRLPFRLFPSIQPGQELRLKDILKEE